MGLCWKEWKHTSGVRSDLHSLKITTSLYQSIQKILFFSEHSTLNIACYVNAPTSAAALGSMPRSRGRGVRDSLSSCTSHPVDIIAEKGFHTS